MTRRKKRALDKLLAFHLLVLKYERIFDTRERAYENAVVEWSTIYTTKSYPTWNAYKVAVVQLLGEVDFYVGRVQNENGLDFVVSVSTSEDWCKRECIGFAIKFPGSYYTIYTSKTGRIDKTSRIVQSYNVIKA